MSSPTVQGAAAAAGESRAWTAIIAASITVPVAILSVALRSYTRAVLIKQFGIDDAAAVVTLVSSPSTLYAVTRRLFRQP